jgi:hypothetical protein
MHNKTLHGSRLTRSISIYVYNHWNILFWSTITSTFKSKATRISPLIPSARHCRYWRKTNCSKDHERGYRTKLRRAFSPAAMLVSRNAASLRQQSSCSARSAHLEPLTSHLIAPRQPVSSHCSGRAPAAEAGGTRPTATRMILVTARLCRVHTILFTKQQIFWMQFNFE